MIATTTILLVYFVPKGTDNQRIWCHLTADVVKIMSVEDLDKPLVYRLALLAVHPELHDEFQVSVNRKNEVTLVYAKGKELKGHRTSINAVTAQTSGLGVSNISSLFANYAWVYSKLTPQPSLTVNKWLKNHKVTKGDKDKKSVRNIKIIQTGPI